MGIITPIISGMQRGLWDDAVLGRSVERARPRIPRNAVTEKPRKTAKIYAGCAVERASVCVRDAGAGGSNPLTPTRITASFPLPTCSKTQCSVVQMDTNP
jgi:hypothetical protein